jgi:hypothetical protein
MVAGLKSRLLSLVLLLVALVGVLVAVGWALIAVIADDKSSRARRVLIALDQTGNAALGGSEYETLSSRADRARTAGMAWGCHICRFLDFLQKDHCKNSLWK